MRWPSKEARERVRLAEKQGWEFAGFTGKGHPKIKHKVSGAVLTLAASPSAQQGRTKFLADLKKHTPLAVSDRC